MSNRIPKKIPETVTIAPATVGFADPSKYMVGIPPKWNLYSSKVMNGIGWPA